MEEEKGKKKEEEDGKEETKKRREKGVKTKRRRLKIERRRIRGRFFFTKSFAFFSARPEKFYVFGSSREREKIDFKRKMQFCSIRKKNLAGN